jgi:hypothetical protein
MLETSVDGEGLCVVYPRRFADGGGLGVWVEDCGFGEDGGGVEGLAVGEHGGFGGEETDWGVAVGGLEGLGSGIRILGSVEAAGGCGAVGGRGRCSLPVWLVEHSTLWDAGDIRIWWLSHAASSTRT